MTIIATYFAGLKSLLAASVGVVRYKIREELVRVDDGVIRLKASLKDGGLLEIAEYVVVQEGRITRVAYSYHWQDKKEMLRIRWDNVAHHPEVSTFPHHIHIGNEGEVIPSEAHGLAEILAEIEKNLAMNKWKSFYRR